MIRRAMIVVLTGGALATAAMCVAVQFTTISWRFDILESPARLVSLRLNASAESLGLSGSWFYGDETPSASDGWSINDRVLQATYEVHDAACYVTRPEAAMREFKGRRSLSAATPFWAAATVSGVFLAFAAIALVRGRLARRRQRMLGQCAHCGHDFSGSNDQTCPKCSTNDGSGQSDSTESEVKPA